jgi:hypothetical protein
MTSYKGDVGDKALARASGQANALRFFRGAVPSGLAIALAGPALGDLEFLRYGLRMAPENVWFVDRDNPDRCLKKAKKIWPGVKVYHGELRDLLLGLEDEGEKVGYSCIDLMGRYAGEEKTIFATLGRISAAEAYTMYTYMRSRGCGLPHCVAAKEWKGYISIRSHRDIAEDIARSWPGSSHWCYECEYQSGSPMSMLGVGRSRRAHTTYRRHKTIQDVAEDMYNYLTSKDVEKILGIKPRKRGVPGAGVKNTAL